jgi:hypothetical protein
MTRVLDRYVERCGHSHELRKRFGSHLSHDVASVDLERGLRDAEF